MNLDKERLKLRVEIRSLEDVIAASGVKITDAELIKAMHGTDQKNSISLSSDWRAIIIRMSSFTHFTSSDVEVEINKLLKDGNIKKEQRPGNIRSQLSLFVKKTILLRVGLANYKVPASTKEALGIAKQK